MYYRDVFEVGEGRNAGEAAAASYFFLACRTADAHRTERSRLYLVSCFSADCSCCSLAFAHLESGLYSFMALARTSVFSPRSLWYTTPFAPTINVITPDDLYSPGYATKAKPPVILPFTM